MKLLNSEQDFEISDEEILKRFKAAIRLDEEKRGILGIPSVRYDYDLKKVYYEYPDGSVKYAKHV